MRWRKVKFSEFLVERKERFKPDVSNELGLNRISKIDFSGCIHVSENKPTKTNMILVKNGDLVISGINADKGAVAIYKGKDNVMATIHYSSYTFDKTKINIDYLTWFLKSKRFIEILRTQAKGGIKTELKAKKLLPLEIDLPTLPLQLEILTKIESMNQENDLLLNEIALKIKLTKKLKQTIIQEAIEGKLTVDWRKENPNTETASALLKCIKEEKYQLIADKKRKKEKPLPLITEEEILFELPKSWEWCRLGNITNYGSSQKIDSEEIKADTWVLDLEDIEKESSKILQYKTFSDRPSLSTKSIFKKGWVLYSKLRPYLDKVVVALNDGVCTTEILPLPIYSRLQSHYLMYTLKGKHFLNYVNSKVGGMKMPRLGTSDGKMALIPLAPLEEQKVIIRKVESLMKKCQVLEQVIKTSEAHAQMLMQAVLKEAFEVKKEVEIQF